MQAILSLDQGKLLKKLNFKSEPKGTPYSDIAPSVEFKKSILYKK